jgi:linoleoyl-CoA desaturase
MGPLLRLLEPSPGLGAGGPRSPGEPPGVSLGGASAAAQLARESTGRRVITYGGGYVALTERISFDSGGEFMRETRREVEAYLALRSTRRSAYIRLYVKPPIAVGLMALSWSLLLFAPAGPVLTPLSFAGLLLGAIVTAFCVQHDANHGAYFRSTRYNHLLGWSADALLGISSYSWRVRHNVAHHTYTNVDGHDGDITQMPVAKLVRAQPSKPWYRFQHLYLWPLYGFMGMRLQAVGDFTTLHRGRIARTPLRTPRRWDLAGFIAGKLIFLSWALLIPLLLYPWWIVLLSFLGVSLALSLTMVLIFQLAHCVEEAADASADELRAEKRVWAVFQVESTVDFCPRNPVLTWLLGGLNYQIEHHLFPRTPHTHYPAIARIVRRTAAKHGVTYTVQSSLWAALSSHARHLRSMGAQGLPVDLEMG